MAKEELPADRVKREAAEKAERDKLDAQKKALEDAAEKEAAGIAADEARDKVRMQAESDEATRYDAEQAALYGSRDMEGEDVSLFSADPPKRPSRAEAEEAHKKLAQIAQNYPLTTPDEHTIFGFAGIKFSLGDLRALFGLQRSR